MTWQNQQLPADHPAVKSGGVGVLIVNLGTPDAPEKGPVKRYLAEFLSDRRVVEIPAIAWQPILRGIILNTRPKKSAHAYSQVWSEEGSPLAVITRKQAEAMQQRLGDDVTVDWAMRYGTPSIPERIQALMDAGCERILLAPLYPQYSAATTATVVDKAADKLRTMRWQAFAPHPATLSRRSCLYRCARRRPVTPARCAGFRARSAAAEFSRHAAAHARTGRSVSLPLPEDFATSSGTAGAPGAALPDHFPVALRAGQVAGSGDRRHVGGRSAGGDEKARNRGAGLFRRLPRDAGRARHPGARAVYRSRGRAVRCAFLPQYVDAGLTMLEHLLRRELSGWIL